MAAVTPIIRELYNDGSIKLVDSNIISECSAIGRRQSYFQIDKDWKSVLAINIYPDYIYYGLTNLFGETIYEEKEKNSIDKNTSSWVQRIAYHCIDFLRTRDFPLARVLGVGITILGPVDHDNGIALHPYTIYDRQVPIKDLFAKYLPCPISVESNVCAVLRSELLFRKVINNSQNVMMLKWGPGIGSALAINGINYKGYDYQSSEIGHNIYSAINGKKCRCGRCGCLETLVSENAMCEDIIRYIDNHIDPEINLLASKAGLPSSENIIRYIAQPSHVLKEYLLTCVKKVALAANNAIMLMSPEKLILSGNFFTCDWIYKSFTEEIIKRNPLLKDSLFSRSNVEQEYPFIGATAIAIENTLL